MKRNTNKYHLLISGNKDEQMWTKLERDIVWESNDVKLLGITLDNNLKFDKHVSNICSKANRKLSALTIHTGKNLSFTEFSTKIHRNTRLAACDVFQMFT